MKKFGAITSSVNPEDVATRVKGIVLTLSSIIILIAASVFHITLTATDILTLAGSVGAVAGAITTLYGAFMWVLVYFFKKPTTDIATQPSI